MKRLNKKILWGVVVFFALVYALMLVLAMSGCATSRKTKTESRELAVFNKIADSSGKLMEKERNRDNSDVRKTVIRDSIGVVPGGETEIDLLPEEVEPVTDVAGKVTGRTFTKREGTMTATVTVDAKGGIKVKCKEDSLRLALFRYRMDSFSLVRQLDSVVSQIVFTDHSEIKDSVAVDKLSESEVKVKGQGWLARTWNGVKTLCTVMVFGWLIFFLIRIFFKR